MTISRRRFAFWIGFGLYTLSNKLRVYALDELAAAVMDGAASDAASAAAPTAEAAAAIHWRVADNGVWRWFERETMIDGKWTLSGITTPVNIKSGEPYEGQTGYLEEDEVPTDVRASAGLVVDNEHHPDPARRARHGRPPSKWLRSLNADELSIWLKTIEVPEADVIGMTFWEHLTRDHMFEAEKIDGLDEADQAKLHAAAHFGY